MFLIYIDESGDDGYPGSSNAFTNTAVQIKSQKWNTVNDKLINFRKKLSQKTKLLEHYEFHTNNIIGRKNPYVNLMLSDEEIKEIIREYAKFIAKLDVLCTSVLVDKTQLTKKVDIFDVGVHHLVNRINTTISVKYRDVNPDDKQFLLFCDQGRIANWHKIINDMKKKNKLYSNEKNKYTAVSLFKLIENPIQRDSRESNFLQLADFVVTMLNKYYQLCILKKTFRSRMSFIDLPFVTEILNIISPILNLDATKQKGHYGLVFFPKK